MAVYPAANKPTLSVPAATPAPVAVVAPAPAPEVAAPSAVVQTERKLEFMKEPVAPEPPIMKKHSARVLAEHAAGAEALSNYA